MTARLGLATVVALVFVATDCEVQAWLVLRDCDSCLRTAAAVA